MSHSLLLLVLFLCFCFAPPSVSGEDAPELTREVTGDEVRELVEKQEIRVSLNAALQLALKNNLQIAIQRVEPDIRAQQVEQEKSVFDPSLSLGVSKDYSVRQTSSTLALPPENIQEDIIVDAGVSDRWVTGAETNLQFTNDRMETNSIFAGLNPTYTSELILSITQPLLKDFGIGTNMAAIRIAANDQKISEFGFRDQVMGILFDVESTYWELVHARQQLEVDQESYRLADDFLKLTRRKVEVGVLPPVDILQAEAEKASREELVITAEDSLRDAEDQLRIVMNLSDDPRYWEVRLIPSDEFFAAESLPEMEDQLRSAVENRPDLNQARKDLESRNIRLKYTRNQLLPRIDLVGSIGLNGLAGSAIPQEDVQRPGFFLLSPFDGDNSDALDEMKSRDYYTYTVGVKVEYPLGNRFAKSEMIMADLEKQKALYALKDLENHVIQEVRGAVRQIETNRKRIAAAEAARRLAEERLRSETRRFEVGLATSHDVLEFQEKLSVARSSELRARIDYRESLVNLERVKGTLLQSKGIVL